MNEEMLAKHYLISEDMFAQTTDNINECVWQTLTLFVKHAWQMKVLSIQHADDMFNIFNQLDIEHKYLSEGNSKVSVQQAVSVPT